MANPRFRMSTEDRPDIRFTFDGTALALNDDPAHVPGTQPTLYHYFSLGQSNETAEESKPVAAGTAFPKLARMFARGIQTWLSGSNPEAPASRPYGQFLLTTMANATVERFAVAFADRFLQDLNGSSVNDGVLVTSTGMGARYNSELGPDADTSRGVVNGHWVTLVDDIARGKDHAALAGYLWRPSGLFYDQGEAESTDQGQGGDADFRLIFGGTFYTASQVIDGYADKLVEMAEAFDAAVEAEAGTAGPYRTYLTPPNMVIGASAHRQAAEASALIVHTGPRYQMPSALNASNGLSGGSQAWGDFIHHSPDAHRWKGEMRAKIARQLLAAGSFDGMHIVSLTKTGAGRVRAVLHVHTPPIVVDTTSMAKLMGWGFTLCTGTIDAPVASQFATAVTIVSDTEIDIDFASIPAGAFMMLGYTSRCDLGGTGTIDDISAADDSAAGFDQEAVTLDVNLAAALAPLMNDGAFYCRGATSAARMTVRSVSFGAGTTVLVGETRERSGTFTEGEAVDFYRVNLATNIRDSDAAVARRTFLQGPRAGQPYPLWNWLELSRFIEISGA